MKTKRLGYITVWLIVIVSIVSVLNHTLHSDGLFVVKAHMIGAGGIVCLLILYGRGGRTKKVTILVRSTVITCTCVCTLVVEGITYFLQRSDVPITLALGFSSTICIIVMLMYMLYSDKSNYLYHMYEVRRIEYYLFLCHIMMFVLVTICGVYTYIFEEQWMMVCGTICLAIGIIFFFIGRVIRKSVIYKHV
jgi:peptidoglycan biosynthesis protein MviN/MurJ (putative lipid II flippase)